MPHPLSGRPRLTPTPACLFAVALGAAAAHVARADPLPPVGPPVQTQPSGARPVPRPTADWLAREQMAKRIAARLHPTWFVADLQPKIGPVSLLPGNDLIPVRAWVIAAGQVARDQVIAGAGAAIGDGPAGGLLPAGAGPPAVPPEPPPVAQAVPADPQVLVARLRAADERARSMVSARPDGTDGQTRESDVAVARAYLALNDGEDAWAAVAGGVLEGNHALTDRDERDLIARAARLPPDESPRVTAFLLGRGRAVVVSLVGALDESTPQRSARVLDLLRRLCAREPTVLSEDLPALMDPSRLPMALRGRAAYAIDQLTSGPDALPVPAGAVDAWTRMLLQDVQPNAAVAAEVLVRRGEHGLRDADLPTLCMVADLRAEAPSLRENAIRGLARIGGDRPHPLTVRTLGGALSDADPMIRLAAARALERAGHHAAPVAAELAKLVVGTPPLPPNVLPTTGGQLWAERWSVAAAATTSARAIARVGGAAAPAAAPILVRGLAEPASRDVAAAALIGIGPDAVPAVMQAYAGAAGGEQAGVETRRAAVAVLDDAALAGPAAEAALVAVLRTEPAPAVRAEACRGLARARRDPAAARRLLAGELTSDAEEVAMAAAEALTRLGPGVDFDPATVLPWLAEGNRDRRTAAARLMAAAGPRVANVAVPPLLRMADNVCGVQRDAAARALAAVDPDGRRLAPALLSAVYHRDRNMRHLLLPAARRSADPKVQGRLKDVAANDPDPAVRASAGEAMTELARL